MSPFIEAVGISAVLALNETHYLYLWQQAPRREWRQARLDVVIFIVIVSWVVNTPGSPYPSVAAFIDFAAQAELVRFVRSFCF